MQNKKILKIVASVLVAIALFVLVSGVVSMLVDVVMAEHALDFIGSGDGVRNGFSTIRWMELGIVCLIVASLAFFIANCFVKGKMLTISAIAVDGVLFAALFASLFIAKAAIFTEDETSNSALSMATAFQNNVVPLMVSSVVLVLADVARLVCKCKCSSEQTQQEEVQA